MANLRDGGSSHSPEETRQSSECLNDSIMSESSNENESPPSSPPSTVQSLWREVAVGIDKNSTVIWKHAVDSLAQCRKHQFTSQDAQTFLQRYMKPIISILLEQSPSKIGPMERNCVEESLSTAIEIVAAQLKTVLHPSDGDATECLHVLSNALSRKKVYYKGTRNTWNNNASGLPEVRVRLLMKFRDLDGFEALGQYLTNRVGQATFPSLDMMRPIMTATIEALPQTPNASIETETHILSVVQGIMLHMERVPEDYLKKMAQDHSVKHLIAEVSKIFDRLCILRKRQANRVYEFMLNFTLRLISSQSLPLKLIGWDTISELIDLSAEHRPPPKAYIVKGAGRDFVNGTYEFASRLTEEGTLAPNSDLKYVYEIPVNDLRPEEIQKTITLFRCTMRSSQKWWFLSEADKDQPGTDKDIDYYQHKSKKHEEALPPLSGWITSRNAGLEPAPTLEPRGLVVPDGMEYSTLEHQLAKWAIVNKVIELVLGNSIHREIVARSIPLIRFLASMCNKDDHDTGIINGVKPNAYCLQASHLKLAWKTCTSKLDSAISAEVYQLLVSILPSLPEALAIQLINSIQNSLRENANKTDYLFEVAEFCSTLANLNSSGSHLEAPFLDGVRTEVLKLLWSVLAHPSASSLKCYDRLKSYVTNELRVKPTGATQRETFLLSCKVALSKNSTAETVDEELALRMVNLTWFILEACPREQVANEIIADDNALPKLLFSEITAYIKRRTLKELQQGTKKHPSTASDDDRRHPLALRKRFDIIRYVYGVRSDLNMSTDQLNELWKVCKSPIDREEIFVFLANASKRSNDGSLNDELTPTGRQQETSHVLYSSFSDEICAYAFQKLSCSNTVDWENLGVNAYESFQTQFKNLSKPLRSSLIAKGPALDALWRISLQAGNDNVASQAMSDLLNVYSQISAAKRRSSAAGAWAEKDPLVETKESFAQKIFDCLEEVKLDLKSKNSSSIRSAERCVRILNSAVGHGYSDSTKGQSSSLYSSQVSSLASTDSYAGIIRSIPHGLRGQSCYRTIFVSAKRAQQSRYPQTQRFSMQVHPLETLSHVSWKVSVHCKHDHSLVKPISMSRKNLNIESEEALVGDLGMTEGAEVIFLLANAPVGENRSGQNFRKSAKKSGVDLEDFFGEKAPDDRFFDTLLDVLEVITTLGDDDKKRSPDTHGLVWDLLLSVPSNYGLVDKVRSIAQREILSMGEVTDGKDEDNLMAVDTKRRDKDWDSLLNPNNYQRAIYVLQIVDSFLLPATEIVQGNKHEKALKQAIERDASCFRHGFIESGGFESILRFFTRGSGLIDSGHSYRMENACVLRILKSCFFGKINYLTYTNDKAITLPKLDGPGKVILNSNQQPKALLLSLISTVVKDQDASHGTILDAILLLQVVLDYNLEMTACFASLPDNMAEKFTITLLLWENKRSINATAVGTGCQIRKSTEELLFRTNGLVDFALPWLIKALESVPSQSDCCSELFSALIRSIDGSVEKSNRSSTTTTTKTIKSNSHLSLLATAACEKLASHPQPSPDSPTSVLCGCLELLKNIILGGEADYGDGAQLLLSSMKLVPWVANEQVNINEKSATIINLMGSIFDGFLLARESSPSLAICCDRNSRKLGFDVVAACARSCEGEDGYLALSSRISDIIKLSSPSLRHLWGQNIGLEDKGRSGSVVTSKYSGLRNQGCTCYMNSVLQQLFMMPGLQKSLTSATLPSKLRSTGSSFVTRGEDLIGKQISLQWDNGTTYDATVLNYNNHTGMHTIQYAPLHLTAPVGGIGGNMGSQVHPDDIAGLPEEMPDEFVLSEGRPGKEIGGFDIIPSSKEESGKNKNNDEAIVESSVKETENEASYRRLLEEVQKTFVHLDEGARGRVFDPRTLVEASGCLNLEFDVWQQNDASEFAMKLLDRIEVPLKRWSHDEFKYLENTFRLKQTKQKICKECGLKTNIEENLMNIDCQIRGKSDIHEALATMCEVEYMEGDNKVYCESCKRNTDTILRTAISALPDTLILSLKRFDLDYNTFETVKLNSRCAFGQTLNMKQYTMEGVEAMEKGSETKESDGMECDDNLDPFSQLPDEDYEYKLAGVLVHHGVAQGGHYYSFIRDRSSGKDKEENKWYRFDDEDVTPFDPSSIEVECFGGKVKKETKWPNGQVHTVESDQLANALMLFYEKVRPAEIDTENKNSDDSEMDTNSENKPDIALSTGVDVFEASVKRSNSTHRSHGFLFDPDFQEFLNGLLSLCLESREQEGNSMEISTTLEVVSKKYTLERSCYLSLLKLSLSYFFDVLLHSVESGVLERWTNTLINALKSFPEASKSLVKDIARRSAKNNENWLRTYAAECPEDLSRPAAMKIFSVAIESSLIFPEERESLELWIQAYFKQNQAQESSQLRDNSKARPVYTCLQSPWQCHEDLQNIENGQASSIGIILSFLSSLLEVAPRTWRYSNDLCALIRDISNVPGEGGIIRKALIASQFPARLMCLVMRDKAPAQLRLSMPGAALAPDVANAMIKPETNPVPQLLPLPNSSVGMSGMNSGVNTPSSPSYADHINALEALACIIGLQGMKCEPLMQETGESIKHRAVLDLTKAAKDALTTIFNEFTRGEKSGMDYEDISRYMKKCNVENISGFNQRISNILNKYGQESKILTLEGFLDYYRDLLTQSNNMSSQLRSDLRMFGYRPDLTRRSEEARLTSCGQRNIFESIAIDAIKGSRRDASIQLGHLATMGLTSFNLYFTAFFTSRHLAEYLLVASCYQNDVRSLISESLRTLYQAQSGWGGNEIITVCVMIFNILVMVPDDLQKERISILLESEESQDNRSQLSGGLLHVAKTISTLANDYHNSTILEKCTDVLKELNQLEPVENWIAENKKHSNWIERWLGSETGNDRMVQDFDNGQSDSDLNDDDDSNYDGHVTRIQVSGAGIEGVNGIYSENGQFDSVKKYTKNGQWNGRPCVFSMFRCRLSNNAQRWYISIVPNSLAPGTNKDIDFYHAESNGDAIEIPHRYQWVTMKGEHGADPAPFSSLFDDGNPVVDTDEGDGDSELMMGYV